MDDDLLREACRNYDEIRLEQLMHSLDMQPVHLFSKQYEKEKNKIIRQYESYSISRNQFSGRKISKKTIRILLVAALLLALLVASALAFEPVRHYIFSYFDGTDIIFSDDQIKDSLNESFTYIPQGYVLEEEQHTKLSNDFTYLDSFQNSIDIHTAKNGSSVFINSENKGYEEIDIQGFTGYFVEQENEFILTWSTGKYHHILTAGISTTTHISKDDILKIARSRTIF